MKKLPGGGDGHFYWPLVPIWPRILRFGLALPYLGIEKFSPTP